MSVKLVVYLCVALTVKYLGVCLPGFWSSQPFVTTYSVSHVMGLVTSHQFCWNFHVTLGGLLFGLGFSQWAGSFLSMFGVLRKTVLP